VFVYVLAVGWADFTELETISLTWVPRSAAILSA